MTAADKREELEALLWRSTSVRAAAGETFMAARERARTQVAGILASVDAYATAVADERIAGRVHDRTIGRERLADLNAAVKGGS